MKKISKVLKVTSVVVSILFLLLFLLSWVDIVVHNIPGNAGYKDYSNWNIFTNIRLRGDMYE